MLLLNVFKDLLVIFCVDYHISLYSIERRDNSANPIATISRIQDLSLANFVPHPTSLVSLTLTSLRSETGQFILNHSDQKQVSSYSITQIRNRSLAIQSLRSETGQFILNHSDQKQVTCNSVTQIRNRSIHTQLLKSEIGQVSCSKAHVSCQTGIQILILMTLPPEPCRIH